MGIGKIAEASGKFACIRMVDLLEKPGKYDGLRMKILDLILLEKRRNVYREEKMI